MKIFFLISLFCLFQGCAQQRSDVGQVTNVQGGRCLLSKSGSSFLCLNFNSGYDSNTAFTTCESEKSRYQTSAGVSGISWLSGNSNTCSTATSSTSVGSCTRADSIIYYYNNFWTAGTAQTDCTSIHNGTWTP
jgi:hypothetical protein